MNVRFEALLIGLTCLFLQSAPALAAKGDLRYPRVMRAPLLEGRALDLRFTDFAQGIWTREDGDCRDLATIDTAKPGRALAIFRGMMETPTRICHIYGAEQGAAHSQRAALNCLRSDGAETLGLVTVHQRGTAHLLVQDGEQPPINYRFCKVIKPILLPVGQ